MGEISESFEYGLNAAATEYDGKHKYIRITDIDDSTHLFLQDDLTSPDIDFSTADDYLLQEGDVLFARTGASVGKTYIYRRSDGDLYFAGFLIRAKIKSDYDADFVFQNTLTDSYDSYIRITSQRSGQPGVNAQEYANFALSVPSLAEQKKIGAYFSHLDSLITLHQRNSHCSVSCFFSHFTNTWEQRKLGELSEKTFGGGTPNTSNNEYWNGDIPWFQSSDISDGKLFDIAPKKFISQDGLSKSAAQLIPENSIAIITRVGVGKLAFVPFSYTTSQDFLSLSRLKTEPFFTVYACYKKLQSELNAVQGTSIKGITKDELLAKQIMIPNYAEQRQIGAYFKSLDNLITLHQCKHIFE